MCRPPVSGSECKQDGPDTAQSHRCAPVRGGAGGHRVGAGGAWPRVLRGAAEQPGKRRARELCVVEPGHERGRGADMDTVSRGREAFGASGSPRVTTLGPLPPRPPCSPGHSRPPGLRGLRDALCRTLVLSPGPEWCAGEAGVAGMEKVSSRRRPARVSMGTCGCLSEDGPPGCSPRCPDPQATQEGPPGLTRPHGLSGCPHGGRHSPAVRTRGSSTRGQSVTQKW